MEEFLSYPEERGLIIAVAAALTIFPGRGNFTQKLLCRGTSGQRPGPAPCVRCRSINLFLFISLAYILKKRILVCDLVNEGIMISVDK